ncbi:alpha/beta hydrolase [Dactylosporangium siamense]|uniref:alpha/beta hydrolase n=1 Tax=Dactylosporangium siamense TaxID=685454 RepID=UPI001941DF60|nr:alpha/beta hydrolase [Dactylosporangium siamense]
MRYRSAFIAALVLGGVLTTSPASAEPGRQRAVSWHSCVIGADDVLGAALEQAGARCGEVSVPLDYGRPRGRTIQVAMARVAATDPARRRGILMLNPGGPGGSGMELVLAGAQMPAVAARYDLIGMDPRFVGRSSPLECRWETDTFVRSAGPDRRTFNESVALANELAAGCTRGNRDLLPYASTRNTARDMDLIRQALGERQLSYLGYSYGTYLGAVYLQMFGAHADRVVLDSAVDPDVYGPGLLSRNAPAIQAALEHWAGWAAGGHGLGTTRREVLERVYRLAARTVHTGPYTVDPHVLPYLLFARLYDDSAGTYEELAEEIRVLEREGPPTPALEAFLAGLSTGAGYSSDRAGTAVLCADRAAGTNPDSYYRDIQAHRGDEPLFGPMTRNITPCAFWPVRPEEAATTIRNTVPALIVGADGDPATPFAGQLAMHRALQGSRMLTVRGRYAHGQYLVAGSACVDGTVERYLVDGVLPVRDTGCRLSGPGRAAVRG